MFVFDVIKLGSYAPRTDRHRIAGITYVNGTPGSKLVVALDRTSMVLVASMWSDPVTGVFEFKGLQQFAERQLLVFSLDNTGQYNAEVADFISQVTAV